MPHQFAVDQPRTGGSLADWDERARSGPGIQEIEFFANAEDSELLLQLHATDIRRQAAIQIAEEIKSALPESARDLGTAQPARPQFRNRNKS